MCDDNGCSAECKEKCMSMYDENGKFKGDVATEEVEVVQEVDTLKQE